MKVAKVGRKQIYYLNELEYFKDKKTNADYVLANVFTTDEIVKIDIVSG